MEKRTAWVGWAKFSFATFFSALRFVWARNNLEHFGAVFCRPKWRMGFRLRIGTRIGTGTGQTGNGECGPQAETPNTSHSWIYVMPLIGCCADVELERGVPGPVFILIPILEYQSWSFPTPAPGTGTGTGLFRKQQFCLHPLAGKSSFFLLGCCFFFLVSSSRSG